MKGLGKVHRELFQTCEALRISMNMHGSLYGLKIDKNLQTPISPDFYPSRFTLPPTLD